LLDGDYSLPIRENSWRHHPQKPDSQRTEVSQHGYDPPEKLFVTAPELPAAGKTFSALLNTLYVFKNRI
jgi:hypothetical protein